MRIKVCGIKQQEQLDQLVDLGIDMVGFNYYGPSPRFLEQKLATAKGSIVRVGVFVNADLEELSTVQLKDDLDFLQLHGTETAEFCAHASTLAPVIKAFGLHRDFDFSVLSDYEPFVEYFLFDTKTPGYGGSGKKFDWEILTEYKGRTPFLLSGGISLTDVDDIKKISHEALAGIDVNSGFEISPGNKDMEKIKDLKKQL